MLQIGAGAMGSRRLRDLRERGDLLLAVLRPAGRPSRRCPQTLWRKDLWQLTRGVGLETIGPDRVDAAGRQA